MNSNICYIFFSNFGILKNNFTKISENIKPKIFKIMLNKLQSSKYATMILVGINKLDINRLLFRKVCTFYDKFKSEDKSLPAKIPCNHLEIYLKPNLFIFTFN